MSTTATTKPTKKAVGPISLMDHPGYRQASQTLAGLKRQKAELEPKISELQSRIAKLRGDTAGDDKPGGLKHMDRVMALLGRKAPSGPELGLNAALAELRELYTQRAALDEACDVQRAEVDRLAYVASEEICRQREPEFRQLIRRLAESLNDLDTAIEAAQKFWGDFQDSGATECGPFAYPLPTYCDDPATPPGWWSAWFKSWGEYANVKPRRFDPTA